MLTGFPKSSFRWGEPNTYFIELGHKAEARTTYLAELADRLCAQFPISFEIYAFVADLPEHWICEAQLIADIQ